VVRNGVVWCEFRPSEWAGTGLLLLVEALGGGSDFPGSQGGRGSLPLSSTRSDQVLRYLFLIFGQQMRLTGRFFCVAGHDLAKVSRSSGRPTDDGPAVRGGRLAVDPG
jgi:hypothetical protein